MVTEKELFELELEFVQTLANPGYLRHIIQKGCLEDERFLGYLRYLAYFKRKEYICFIEYPDCLEVLDLLLLDETRRALIEDEYSFGAQQYAGWLRRERRGFT
ncbi:MAG: Mediator of RNA polymerase II transcription subunit 31 [Amphiamblys sp. WSBS2006]|nr:MAG: Mediator of RNA polymerase II transcription subunit 31 [Amphiamblys sp. WSBS2006]